MKSDFDFKISKIQHLISTSNFTRALRETQKWESLVLMSASVCDRCYASSSSVFLRRKEATVGRLGPKAPDVAVQALRGAVVQR